MNIKLKPIVLVSLTSLAGLLFPTFTLHVIFPVLDWISALFDAWGISFLFIWLSICCGLMGFGFGMMCISAASNARK
ncbi:MAG: hypothetical protein ISN29_04555 [Gammaproteobacteria bacterium AqS3]|nr:hypothetical protein [Gammaproteobacteria bacterium AqS3]